MKKNKSETTFKKTYVPRKLRIKSAEPKKDLQKEQAYNQTSEKVPVYYNRPGPADHAPELLKPNLEIQSKHGRIHVSPIGRAGLATGEAYLQGHQHRFQDFNKALLNAEIWQ